MSYRIINQATGEPLDAIELHVLARAYQAAWQRLGYQPQDNAETFAAQVQHLLQPEGPQRTHQGGSFMGIGPFDDDTEV